MSQSIAILVHMAAAGDPVPPALPPTTRWAVEYAPNMCVLSRSFGGSAQAPAAILALRPLPLSNGVEMVLATPAKGVQAARKGRMKVTMQPSGQEQETRFERAPDASGRRTLTTFGISSETLDAMKTAQVVELAIGREPPVRLATGSATKALAAVVPCQDDLLKTWGNDPTIQERIGTAAVPQGGGIGAFFERGYYPQTAIQKRQEGRTTIAWTIDATGKTRDCRIVASSGVRELDLTTCAVILQKARYTPALDKAGRPMESFQVQAIRWSLDD